MSEQSEQKNVAKSENNGAPPKRNKPNNNFQIRIVCNYCLMGNCLKNTDEQKKDEKYFHLPHNVRVDTETQNILLKENMRKKNQYHNNRY